MIGLTSDDEGGGQRPGDADRDDADRDGGRARAEPPRPRRVQLRIVPVTPTYVCVDHGPGTDVVFENTIDAPQTFRGKRVRVLLGKREISCG